MRSPPPRPVDQVAAFHHTFPPCALASEPANHELNPLKTVRQNQPLLKVAGVGYFVSPTETLINMYVTLSQSSLGSIPDNALCKLNNLKWCLSQEFQYRLCVDTGDHIFNLRTQSSGAEPVLWRSLREPLTGRVSEHLSHLDPSSVRVGLFVFIQVLIKLLLLRQGHRNREGLFPQAAGSLSGARHQQAMVQVPVIDVQGVQKRAGKDE